MKDITQELTPAETNPHRWITPQVFYSFAQDLKINYHCQKCAMLPKLHYCDTGHEEGYLPRSSAYTSTVEGYANMSLSRHIPCVRVICVHCGNIDMYSMFAIENWRTVKQHHESNPPPIGLFEQEL